MKHFHLYLTLFLSAANGLLCFAAEVGPPIVVGQTFMADSLDPRRGSTPWALVSHGVAEKLFTVNKDDDIVPQIAKSVTKVDNEGKMWDITIKSGYKFSDGTAVDAQHVANSLNELNNDNSNAQASLGSMTAIATNDLVVRVESERPTPIMDAVLAEWVFVIYYINDDDDFIYTGPYVVETFEEDDFINLVPNEYHDQASERPYVQIKKYANGDALADALSAGTIDVAFHLPIDRLPALRDSAGVNIESFEVGYHYMVFYNTKDGPMSDVSVRKAVDLAIDRKVLSQALKGGRGTRSFFPDFSPYFTDDSEPKGKEDEASAILESTGWALGSDGVRTKDGKTLEVKLVAYPHRPGLVIMQPEIKKALQKIGFSVNDVLTSMKWDETADIINTKDFDMLMWAQHTLPAGDPAWFLNAFFRTDGANNHAQYSSSFVDSLLDTLAATEGHTNRVAISRNIHNELNSDLPMSNLVTPEWHVGLSDRVDDYYTPRGSDYYVIRSDTFLGIETTKHSDPNSGAKASSSALWSILGLVATAVVLM